MTKISKKIILPGILVTAFMIAAIYGSGQVFAVNATNYSPVVERIADKFGLKASDVNEVFEQEKADMWQNRKQMFSARLDQAVKDGKITESQKQKILDKEDEMQANREAERKQNREDMQNFLKSNGIDPTILMPYFGTGKYARHHFNMMK